MNIMLILYKYKDSDIERKKKNKKKGRKRRKKREIIWELDSIYNFSDSIGFVILKFISPFNGYIKL